jgi:K(+)-stimulated pyrophosphate-energized sodium pump
MLSHTGNNVAMDSYGPISDNANGIGEMAWHDQTDEETRKARAIMSDLDAVGNTTKAITKGVAIASAVIAAVSLFASYITDVGRAQVALGLPVMQEIGVSNIAVFIGLLLGGALPWLFSSLAIRAVSRAAGEIVLEVRRQFRVPGVLEGTTRPDYARVVSISTASSQKELIPLATISILVPLLVGPFLGVKVGRLPGGNILSGVVSRLHVKQRRWDNAKKAPKMSQQPALNTEKARAS